MKTKWPFILLALLLIGGVDGAQKAGPAPRRSMAVTIDDLPYMNLGRQQDYLENARRATTEVLRVLQAHRAPAVGLVNEGKLWASPRERDERIALLRQWVDAGMILGNH